MARALGISRHTVDQRLRLAMKALGAENRVEAALTLRRLEGEERCERLIHQPSELGARPAPRPDSALAPKEAGSDERLRRIVWMVAIAAALAVAFAATFVGLNALSDFTR